MIIFFIYFQLSYLIECDDMTDVIKRNGQTEPFREEKIKNSIEHAVQDAGYNINEKRFIINQTINDVKQVIGDVDLVESGEIRNIVLNDLEKEEGGENRIADSWRNYEKTHGIIYKEYSEE